MKNYFKAHHKTIFAKIDLCITLILIFTWAMLLLQILGKFLQDK
jgi:hypothetical protein